MVQFYNTSCVYCAVHSPSTVKSPSTTRYWTAFTLFYLLPFPCNQTFALLPSNHVTLGQVLKLPGPQFSHLLSGERTMPTHRLLGRVRGVSQCSQHTAAIYSANLCQKWLHCSIQQGCFFTCFVASGPQNLTARYEVIQAWQYLNGSLGVHVLERNGQIHFHLRISSNF